MKKISIITVNFNNEAGLATTLQSVSSQVYEDFEFIVIDGGSNGGDKQLIDQHRKLIDILVSEPDTGIYNAMNKGIMLANGQYVYFLNSGDTFYDKFTLLNVAEKMVDDIDLYYGNLIYNWPSGQKLVSFPEKLSYAFFVTDNINHQACFIKKALFNKLFYYNENYKIISDWEFLVYAVCKAEISYQHLHLSISIYDTTGISSDINNLKEIEADKDKVLAEFFPLFLYNREEILVLKTKRTKQFFYIKQSRIAFRLLKWFMSLLLVFLPKYTPND